MSKILLIVSAVLLLGSSALSFVNKGKLTASLEDSKHAQADILSARQDATKSKTALKQAQNEAAAASQKASDATMQLAPFQSQITDLNAKVDAANKLAADKDAQLVALNKQLDALPKSANSAPGEDIAKQIDDLKRKADELQVVKDGLANQLAAVNAQLATSAKRERDRESKVLMQGLQGRVLAVDRNWNFVVLNLGDQKGVVNNSTMIVQRGGELVGRVKITSVEPSQSIADIIPNSVPPGVTVQAGDTVVFPGT